MTLSEEDNELLDAIRKAVQDAIDVTTASYDMSYYELKLTCNVLGSDCSIVLDSVTLIDTAEHCKCVFCDKPTRYYDKQRDQHLCAKCCADLEGEG